MVINSKWLFGIRLAFSVLFIVFVLLFLAAVFFSLDNFDYGILIVQIAILTGVLVDIVYQKQTYGRGFIQWGIYHVVSLLVFVGLLFHDMIDFNALGFHYLKINNIGYILAAVTLSCTIVWLMRRTMSKVEVMKPREINFISIIIGAMVALLLSSTVKIAEHFLESTGINYSIDLIVFLTISILFYTMVHYMIRSRMEVVAAGNDSTAVIGPVDESARHSWQPLGDLRELLELITRIEYELEVNKLYLEPAVSLEMLSEKTEIPKHKISHILKSHFQKGFYHLIGEYRVKHAMQLLSKDHHISMDGLSEVCGFNSKTTFYKYFKRINGCTPTQFVQNLNRGPGTEYTFS